MTKKTSVTDLVAFLTEVPIFSGLSQKQLRAVAREGKEVARPAGSTLAREGQSGVGFFLILEGSADVTVRGRKRSTLGAGDAFGEISLLDGGPRTATVTATSPVRMLGLTAWAFKSLVREHPSIALRLLEVLAGHVRRSTKEPL